MLGGGSAGFSKLVSLGTIAFSVPLTVRYLGPERYGMWMTISSLLALMTFADLGLGSGLVSTISGSVGRRDNAAIVQAVSSAFFLLCGISAAILVIFLATYQFVPWGRLFAVHGADALVEVGPSVAAFVVCFAIGLPFSVVQRLQMGFQESWRSNIWQAGGSLFTLFGILWVVSRRAGVIWLVVAASGGPVITSIMNGIVEFVSRRREFRPNLSMFSIDTSKRLFRSGTMYVALQLCVVMGTASDSIIIANVNGASNVGAYAVMYKLFQTSLVFSLFMYPLWPAFGESLARSDYAWARSAMTRALKFCLFIGSLLAGVLLLSSQMIIRYWAGATVVPGITLVAAFAVWVLLAAYGGAVTSLLNNPQFLRSQLGLYGLASVVALLLKVPMARWLGPAGVVWATDGAYLFLYCIPAGFIVRKALFATL